MSLSLPHSPASPRPRRGTMGRGDKSYLRRGAPSPGPRGPPGTNSGDICPSAPCPPTPGRESFPSSPSLWPWRAASAPLRGPGRHRGHSPAENWPRADPSRGHGARSQSATSAGSAAAAGSMSTLGEVSSSFAKSCPEDRREIHDWGAGRASRGASGRSPAARRHFSLLGGRQTTSGAPRWLASPGGRGGGSPWLGGGSSRSPGVTLLGEGRGRSRGVT